MTGSVASTARKDAHGDFALPRRVGVGYKAQHFKDLLDAPGPVAWLEIHAENYLGVGGRPKAQLERLRQDFPVSCHGVGLSIGSEGPLDQEHLQRLKTLNEWLQPAAFSEHLAWSTHESSYLNDLLPVPYNAATLNSVCEHIEQVQDALGRAMMLENPSTYLSFAESDIEETDFIGRIAQRTGCRLLLDVNNVFVSSTNQGWDAREYIDAFPLDRIEEIHLGGHEADEDDDGEILLIDSHGHEVAKDVWDLYSYAVARTGPLPTLIEWDNSVPGWPTLRDEAAKASELLHGLH